MTPHTKTGSELFCRLCYGFDLDIGKAAVVWLLLAKRADEIWIECSTRQLCDDISNILPRMAVFRALAALAEQGIVERVPHPNHNTRIRLNSPALESLLSKPLPQSRYLPGLGTEPIRFLQRFSLNPTDLSVSMESSQ